MDPLLVLIILLAAGFFVLRAVTKSKERKAVESRQATDLAKVRTVAEEDVTRFGEELQRLDGDLLTERLDEATRQDYQRALDSYESAKESLAAVTKSEEIRHVTEALEDGRYAVACVLARVEKRPLPTRRPPCFFNPAHGPSATDIMWAPPGGQQRQIPVCMADADRVQQGAEPDVRTVQQGAGRVPYWQGGPAYSPYASGYFGGFAASGLLPTFMLMTMLSPGWTGGGGAFEDGDDNPDSGDGGDGGDGGDSGDGGDGGDSGGDYGDSGGDGGGFDFGGGDGGGGFDFGGGDFGGF